MQTYLSEGIVLQASDFRDFDQIVTVFTENEGIMKFIAKRGNVVKTGLKSSPLTRGEFVYTIGKSDLYTLRELSIKEHYLELRKNLGSLNTSCECLKAILETQMLHKPAPFLFKLLSAYLAKIHTFSNHDALESSFRLKILLHEGVLDLDADGFFSDEENFLVHQLIVENSFSNLQKIFISADLNIKIRYFFKNAFL
jgi:DNA repair protein RecO (recombination protein O)